MGMDHLVTVLEAGAAAGTGGNAMDAIITAIDTVVSAVSTVFSAMTSNAYLTFVLAGGVLSIAIAKFRQLKKAA